MDKNKAISIIEETFDKAFDKEVFIRFIQNLLNDIDTSENKYREYRGNLIKEAFRTHIAQYTRIGKYIDPNGVALDVLAIEVQDESKLDKARTSLRNFVIDHLEKFEKDYALAAFYSKTDKGYNWRFSFIKLEHQTTVKEGKIKQQKEFTPARRYSFLVGKDEKSHTAKRQLLPLLQNVYNNPLIEDIEKAFSIEVVTDEFFEQYKGLFLRISEHLEGDSQIKNVLESAGTDIPRFTKKLLGQIVFLYFLQKKGWLGVPKEGKWGFGKKDFLQSRFTEDKNYFKDFLQYLFYEALARQHGADNYYERFDCRIPFLNGGLFEADYDWAKFPINIPNSLFRNDEKISKTGDVGTGILDVFDRYNFTIREDEPLEKEVAIDPEMLGKVFENMLEITERKSKGAFYTPREIVHYMCQESLIHYLDNALNSNVPKTDIEELVHNGMYSLENDLQVVEKGKETETYSYKLPESIRASADSIDKLITNIKICDPAIGSGAFPVGLLNELVNIQLILRKHLSNGYLSQKLNIIGLKPEEYDRHTEKYTYRVKRHSIQESIYGVDIDASAIDIARLRLWLSLVVDEEDFDNIEALPNLDYKIVCGNSLIGMPETAMRNWEVEKELERLKETFFAENNESRKKELRIQINSKIRELLDSVENFAGYKIDFDFKLFFSEVWSDGGGFDIVIGNPPYVSQKGADDTPNITYEDREYYRKNYEIFKGIKASGGTKINLFGVWSEKGLKLIKNDGSFSMIVHKNILKVASYKTLRKLILERYSIQEIVDMKSEAFSNITAETIVIRITTKKENDTFKVKIVDRAAKLSDIPFKILHQNSFKNNQDNIFNIYELPFLRVLQDSPNFIALSDLIDIFAFGLDTIDNKKYFSQTADNYRSKPAVMGRHIAKWLPKSHGFVLYDPRILSRDGNPQIFEANEKIIMQRISGNLIAAYDNKQLYCFNSTNILLNPKQNYKIKFLLGLLNSSFLNLYYRKTFSLDADVTVNVTIGYLSKLIVPKTSNTIQLLIEIIVSYILFLKGISVEIVGIYFENVINACVYELYFPEEVHAAKKGIIEHLQDLKPIDDSMTDDQKLAIINSEFERLYDPYHPVRFAVETLDSIEEIRIIKEALKK